MDVAESLLRAGQAPHFSLYPHFEPALGHVHRSAAEIEAYRRELFSFSNSLLPSTPNTTAAFPENPFLTSSLTPASTRTRSPTNEPAPATDDFWGWNTSNGGSSQMGSGQQGHIPDHALSPSFLVPAIQSQSTPVPFEEEKFEAMKAFLESWPYPLPATISALADPHHSLWKDTKASSIIRTIELIVSEIIPHYGEEAANRILNPEAVASQPNHAPSLSLVRSVQPSNFELVTGLPSIPSMGNMAQTAAPNTTELQREIEMCRMVTTALKHKELALKMPRLG